MSLPRILIGVVLVAVGAVFLVEVAGWGDAGEIFADYWPTVIIFAAALMLAANPRRIMQPALIGLIGLVLLGSTTDVLPGEAGDWIWPIIIIGLGLWVLAGVGAIGRTASGDTINSIGFFSGKEIESTSQHFKGGSVAAIFGGAQLDLRRAHPALEGAYLEATAAFGGVDVLVPPGWRVSMTGLPLFGGYANKARFDNPVDPDAPHLDVRALALFGGVEVKRAEVGAEVPS